MAGRKLLYLLRRPVTAGHAAELLPGAEPSSSDDDISVVLLNGATADDSVLPGRTFLLQEDRSLAVRRPELNVISYADLVRLVFEADSTIVI
jgi:hypothetical protein